jgi:acyl-CoA synthetase (NDP forming)
MLDTLFRPRSVAIVGASSDPNKIGGRPLAFLRKARYRGDVYPINPSVGTVQDLPAFASLAEVKGRIDQAIIALPAKAVLGAFDEAVAAGAKSVVVFSSDIREEDALAERARAAGVRLLGPNSLGLFNAHDGFFGTFATALDGAWPRTGPVGVVTQSGAFGSYCFAIAHGRGLGFSHYVATGNECDVDVAECLDYLAGDDATRVIVAALEGCRDGRRLFAALQKARAAGKPVFIMKVGTSEAGAQAAATHTGSLASNDKIFDAAFREAGAHRARSLEELVDCAYAASICPAPKGRKSLVVTTSGGIGVLMADAAEGLSLEPIAPPAAKRIRDKVPLASGVNPVDTSAQILGNLALYADILGTALPGYDVVACYLAHIGRNPAHWAQLRGPLYEVKRSHPGVAFAAVLVADEALRAELEAQGFAVFEDPSRAMRALAALASLPEKPATPKPASGERVALPAGPLTERQAKQILEAAGVPVSPEKTAKTAEEAVAAARAVGFPAVAKILSPDIAHKTEIGGVITGLNTEGAVADAYATLMRRARERAPKARIEGVLVARQLGGVETLVGAHVDPSFGPVVTFGAGGTLAELVADLALRLAPVTRGAALEMIAETRIAKLLGGFRGAPACDSGALAELIVAVSRFAAGNAAQFAGIDLNPVVATPQGAWVLDALIELKETA